MYRYILFAVAALLLACIGFHLLVPTDPGDTRLEEVTSSDSLIVLVHGGAGPDSLATLKRIVRSDFPHSDILTATYVPSVFANIDPYRVANILERGIHKAYAAKQYDRIVLVGHSLGAVLLRKALVWAHGAEDDRGIFGVQGRRAWADKVTRFISLAGINRGWSLDPKPVNMSYPVYAIAHLAEWIASFTGTGRLLYETKRGSPFIADMRVQWIRIARQDLTTGERARLPLSIHVLGDIDDIVSRDDSQDLAVTKEARFITLPNTGHAAMVTELEKGGEASERIRQIRAALTQPEDKLQFDKLQLQDESPHIKRIIYILHGIRDYGVWAETLRNEIEKVKPADVAVTPPKYGYFPMAPFILSWDRQKNVRRFMDEYTENLAKFPQAAQLDFIGHSNGTYVLASALQRYATLRVNNVLFAGSVVPKRYPWRQLIESDRVSRVHNMVATGDWVVALFPRFFEQIAEWAGITSVNGVFDIGSAGFRGFEDSGRPDPEHRIMDAKFVKGTHSSALDLRESAKLQAVVRFALNGEDADLMALATSGSQNPVLDQLSNVSWVVWLLLASLLLGLGYVAGAFLGRLGVAGYVILLAGLLYSF